MTSMLSLASGKRDQTQKREQLAVCFGWEHVEVGFPLAWGLAGDAAMSLQTPTHTRTHILPHTHALICAHIPWARKMMSK